MKNTIDIEKKNRAKQSAGSASLRYGKALGLSLYEIEKIIGISHITLGQSGVDPDSKAGRRAHSLWGLYRALPSNMRHDDAEIRVWIKKPNPVFNGQRPLDVMLCHAGPMRISEYLWNHGSICAMLGSDMSLSLKNPV